MPIPGRCGLGFVHCSSQTAVPKPRLTSIKQSAGFVGDHYGVRAVVEGLGEFIPLLRRFARGLLAGDVADDPMTRCLPSASGCRLPLISSQQAAVRPANAVTKSTHVARMVACENWSNNCTTSGRSSAGLAPVVDLFLQTGCGVEAEQGLRAA